MKSRVAMIGMALAAVGTIALGASQASADGYSAPRAYYAPYNWSGIYVGVNAGWQWGDVGGNLPCVGPPLGASPAAGPCTNLLAVPLPWNTDIDSRFVLGGHVGLQHQFGSIVVGIEGGYTTNELDRKFSSNPGNAAIAPPFPTNCANVFPCQARFDGMWQFGGRLGYAADHWLLYGTAGWARADLITRSAPGVEVADSHHDGLFIGGGVEYAITRNVIIGVEYIHYDFDKDRIVATNPATNPAGVCPLFCFRNLEPDADVVRARLSFKFGREDDRRPLK